MTDKQIIIDGVDASKCEHNHNRKPRENSICNLYPPPLNCKHHPNCLFKQLARKTQECEELKNKLKYIRDENIYLKESATDEQIELALCHWINHRDIKHQVQALFKENN